jgi:hypothetical protein
MNVEIGTETAQFPEKEYIIGIFLAVHWPRLVPVWLQRVLKPNGVLAVGAFDDMGVETPVELSKEQQEHILAAQQRFCQVIID